MLSVEENIQQHSNGVQNGKNGAEEEPPVIDIVINNVVCSFAVRCHLDLKRIAMEGANVEFKRECGMLTMKLRNPNTTASMWSSGKITCTGATSEEEAKMAARKFARRLQKMGFKARFSKFRVVNVLGTCTMPFGIYITKFSQEHRHHASYEPELHPGVTYKIKNIKATLKIFSTGSITITAPCVENVQLAVQHIFPLVYDFKKPKSKDDLNAVKMRNKSHKMNNIQRNTYHDSTDTEDDTEDEDFQFGSDYSGDD